MKHYAPPAMAVKLARSRIVPVRLQCPIRRGNPCPRAPCRPTPPWSCAANLKKHFQRRPSLVVEGDMCLSYADGWANERWAGTARGQVRGPVRDRAAGPRFAVAGDVQVVGGGQAAGLRSGCYLAIQRAAQPEGGKEAVRADVIRVQFQLRPEARRAGPQLVRCELAGREYWHARSPFVRIRRNSSSAI